MSRTRLPLVCVIDPDPAVRDSAYTLFQTQPVQVMTFAGVCAFWEAIGCTRPTCVIAEVELPDGDGIELYIQLLHRHPDMPFALLLSRETGAAPHRARAQGIRAVYQKPLLVDQLRQFVESACVRLDRD